MYYSLPFASKFTNTNTLIKRMNVNDCLISKQNNT